MKTLMVAALLLGLTAYHNSQAIGQAQAGTLRPWGYILPDFIPAGALVSLMEVR